MNLCILTMLEVHLCDTITKFCVDSVVVQQKWRRPQPQLSRQDSGRPRFDSNWFWATRNSRSHELGSERIVYCICQLARGCDCGQLSMGCFWRWLSWICSFSRWCNFHPPSKLVCQFSWIHVGLKGVGATDCSQITGFVVWPRIFHMIGGNGFHDNPDPGSSNCFWSW